MATVTFPARHGRLACILVLALMPCVARPVLADEPGALEQRVKAAFLYKFGSYVDWPESVFPSPETPLRIGVCGADSLASGLAQLVVGRTAQGRRVVVIRLKPTDDLGSVHILFVGRAVVAELPAMMRTLSHTPVLVVSESEGGLAQGAVINFLLVEGRVRFEMPGAAERHGLKLSSRLLAVAQNIVRLP
jgi:hypothetical protein